MLEIIVLVFLCKGIGGIMRGKGRNPLGYQIMTVLFWIGGEFCGAFGYGLFMAVQGDVPEDIGLSAYVAALAGAAAGAIAAYVIAFLMPSLSQQQFPTFQSGTSFQPPPPMGESTNPYNPYDINQPPK